MTRRPGPCLSMCIKIRDPPENQWLPSHSPISSNFLKLKPEVKVTLQKRRLPRENEATKRLVSHIARRFWTPQSRNSSGNSWGTSCHDLSLQGCCNQRHPAMQRQFEGHVGPNVCREVETDSLHLVGCCLHEVLVDIKCSLVG